MNPETVNALIAFMGLYFAGAIIALAVGMSRGLDDDEIIAGCAFWPLALQRCPQID